MAMAAVRFAARRLTGQQQQQQQAILRSAVANEQGVLNRGGSPASALRRFASSEASAANAPKISSENPSVSGDSRLMAARQKKEELFDLLTEIQMNKDFPYRLRMKDRRLIQHLTLHAKHRRSSSEWRWYLGEHAINLSLCGISNILACLYMYEKWSSYFDQNKQVQGTDSNSKAGVSSTEPNIEE